MQRTAGSSTYNFSVANSWIFSFATGVHFDDVSRLLTALRKLIDGGGSLVVIEHNLDVIQSADWVIDLGPEGGAGGGEIVAVGTPEEIATTPASHPRQPHRPLAPLSPPRLTAHSKSGRSHQLFAVFPSNAERPITAVDCFSK